MIVTENIYEQVALTASDAKKRGWELGCATFSSCKRYRYQLSRVWKDDESYCVFIGLNPSTATASDDDPTIRRCIGFAKTWGMGGMVMLNLFAFRATDPRQMLRAIDPIGPENDAEIREAVSMSQIEIAAWGGMGSHMKRGDAVRRLISGLHYLRLNSDGSPAHPLYLPKSLMPQRWPEL